MSGTEDESGERRSILKRTSTVGRHKVVNLLSDSEENVRRKGAKGRLTAHVRMDDQDEIGSDVETEEDQNPDDQDDESEDENLMNTPKLMTAKSVSRVKTLEQAHPLKTRVPKMMTAERS
jgi:hypothetical protein